MAKIIRDNLWLCDDCTIAACNDDYSGMDDETEARVREGLDGISDGNGYLVADYDAETDEGVQEFSQNRCDSCNGLAGSRHRFAVLD